jgi:hypothetical protein
MPGLEPGPGAPGAGDEVVGGIGIMATATEPSSKATAVPLRLQ